MKVSMHFRIDDYVREELKKICLDTNQSMSSVVRECMIKFIERYYLNKQKEALGFDEKSTNNITE